MLVVNNCDYICALPVQHNTSLKCLLLDMGCVFFFRAWPFFNFTVLTVNVQKCFWTILKCDKEDLHKYDAVKKRRHAVESASVKRSTGFCCFGKALLLLYSNLIAYYHFFFFFFFLGAIRSTGSTHWKSTCLSWLHDAIPHRHASRRTSFYPHRTWSYKAGNR